MPVQVILMADVKDLGVEGDVVTVSDGYARNFLLPKKIAAPVSSISRKRLEKIRAQRAEAQKVELAAATELAARFEQLSCTITVKVNESDKLFGSVTEAQIAEAIAAHGITVDKSAVLLAEPIKELGVYDVPVKIHSDVKASVKIWVVEE